MEKEKWDESNIPDQRNKVFIVTGPTSGLGFDTSRILAKKNAIVIMAARDVRKAEKVKKEIVGKNKTAKIDVKELNLADLKSIQNFSELIKKKYSAIDCLINNAGIMACPYSKTKDGFEIQMGTNHLGHYALTGLLLPLLQSKSNAKVINISSIAHRSGRINFDDLAWEKRKYRTWSAYSDSKLANLYFTYELSRKLLATNSTLNVLAAHPGYSDTDLQRYSGFFKFLNKIVAQKSTIGGVAGIRAAVDSKTISGQYYGSPSFGGIWGYPTLVKSNRLSHDRENASKLWTLSESLTGISYNLE